MKNTIIIVLLISIYYTGNSQSVETKLHVKQELIKQRDDLLAQVRSIQARIDAINLELGNKSKATNKTKYLTKEVKYSTETNYSNSFDNSNKKPSSPSENYRTYHRGPRGGCYYINSNGNKTYVARNMCN